eukprot:7901981-Alexandrium_andersonii.AAC.1
MPVDPGVKIRQFKIRTLSIWSQRWQMLASRVDSLAVRPRAAARAFSSPPPTELGPPRPAA